MFNALYGRATGEQCQQQKTKSKEKPEPCHNLFTLGLCLLIKNLKLRLHWPFEVLKKPLISSLLGNISLYAPEELPIMADITDHD